MLIKKKKDVKHENLTNHNKTKTGRNQGEQAQKISWLYHFNPSLLVIIDLFSNQHNTVLNTLFVCITA